MYFYSGIGASAWAAAEFVQPNRCLEELETLLSRQPQLCKPIEPWEGETSLPNNP